MITEPGLAAGTEGVPVQLIEVILPEAIASTVMLHFLVPIDPAEVLRHLGQLGVDPLEPEILESAVLRFG